MSLEKEKLLLILSPELSSDGHIIIKKIRPLVKNIKKEIGSNIKVMESQAIEEHFFKALNEEMDRELAFSQDSYFNLRIKESIQALEGRKDKSALLWKSLALFSDNQQDEARGAILSLLIMDPSYSLSQKDFPPKYRSFFEQAHRLFKKQITRYKDVTLFDSLSEKTGKAWKRRFLSALDRAGMDILIIAWLEPVGWNQKLRVFIFRRDVVEDFFEKQIEFVGDPDWRKASKILVNTMFLQ
ncbi:MAG: hypothetical protein IPJ69_00550 [Deltaproteobacteria bacterium]|nr:MAG: hypothetical protein IPJ69_00550 [Deltaproteobacteria bacterium]